MASGRIFTRQQIDEMDNGQTGQGSVFIAGGGFRCRHHWRAVRPEWFDEDEWRELTTDDVDQAPTQPDASEPSGELAETVADNAPPVAAETPPELSAGEKRRRALVETWNQPDRLAELGEGALAEFGQTGQNFTDRPVDFDPAELAAAQDDLRRIYQDTQNRLVADGVDFLTVFRPVGDDLVEVEGVLGEWTTEQPDGDFISERIDARRVLFDSRTPGWKGPSNGVALLRDRPRLVFQTDDFDLGGGLLASEVDPGAERAGTWGIILEAGRENRAPRGQLIHIPSGESVLSGAFTREDLRAAATDLDRFTDVDGLLPTAGTLRGIFEDERAAVQRYATEGRVTIPAARAVLVGEKGKEKLESRPTGIVAEDFVDLGGLSFPVVNTGAIRKKAAKSAAAKDKAGDPIVRWGRAGSKNTTGLVLVEREPGEFELTEVKLHVRGNFALYATDSGWETGGSHTVQEWHLVHLATGLKLKSGVSFFLEGGDAGGRFFPDQGGWRMQEMSEVAAELETMLDPETGAVLPGKSEEWLERLHRLERETAPGVDVRDVLADEDFNPEHWKTNPITTRTRPRYAPANELFDDAERFLDDWNAEDVDIDDLQAALDDRADSIEPTDDLSDVPF